MGFLLSVSRLIDALNERIGRIVYWLVLVMVLVSAGNAMSRYALSIASNAWLELQWYLFAAVFLLCSGYTLRHNEHIRIDVIAGHLSRQGLSELIKRIAFLKGLIPDPLEKHEVPLELAIARDEAAK